VQTGKSVQDTNRLKFRTDQLYFKPPEEMKRDFNDYPGAVERSVEIGNRCNLEIDFGSHHFPRFRFESHVHPGDPGSKESKVSDVNAFLETEARKGLEVRLQEIRARNSDFSTEDTRHYYERLDRELDVIKGMGYSSYFLVVADFVRFAKESSIPVGPGRGSAAGSLVAYSLRAKCRQGRS